MFGAVFFALSRAGGGSPVAFHAASWLLHLCATVCVFVLAHSIFRRRDAAALCAAIFLLNPLQLEPTLWASGLQELLWTALLLFALVVYTGAQMLSVHRLTATLALVALALLSKETAIASVFLLPGADWLLFRWVRGRWLIATYVGLGILAAAYFWIRAQFAVIERSFLVLPDKFFVQKFLSTPYKCFIQPWNVTAAHIPAVVLCATAALALVVLFRAVLRGAGPVVLAGPMVIVFSTTPVYNFFFVGADLRASRYLYFAAFGWALLVTHVTMTLLARRWSIIAASAGMIVFSAIFLHINLPPWRTAGDIVNSIAATIRQGQSPEATAAEWRARYGDGIEVKDGIPTVYRGVYVLLNGYPELRSAVSSLKR
jgi:hypothetical protein